MVNQPYFYETYRKASGAIYAEVPKTVVLVLVF